MHLITAIWSYKGTIKTHSALNLGELTCRTAQKVTQQMRRTMQRKILKLKPILSLGTKAMNTK